MYAELDNSEIYKILHTIIIFLCVIYVLEFNLCIKIIYIFPVL